MAAKTTLPVLTDEQQRLVADNLLLVYKWLATHTWVTRKFGDEAEGMASLWACEAATRYDPATGEWSTFLYSTLRFKFMTASNREAARRRGKVTTSLQGMEEFAAHRLLGNPEHAITLDCLAVTDPDPEFRPFEMADLLAERMRDLPRRLRRVVQLRWIDGKSLSEVGRALKVSMSRAQQLDRAALDWMRGKPQMGYFGRLQHEKARRGIRPHRRTASGKVVAPPTGTPEARMLAVLAAAAGPIHTFDLRDNARVNSSMMKAAREQHPQWFRKYGSWWTLTEDGKKEAGKC